MIWLVKIALQRPYTFVVLALLILIVGPIAAVRSPTDIFPNINIPVISVVWSYAGLPPEDMSGRVIYAYERSLTTTVNDIEHIESQSLPGYGVVKIFFQPNVDIRTATAQVTAISQTVLKFMPPGMTPPMILNYNASTVPILQLVLSSQSVPENKLFDFGQNFIRAQLATVAGASVPSPYGGKVRQIQIDLNQQAMQAKHISAQDVQNALAAQTQIIPAGTQKIGGLEYSVKLNNSPDAIDELNNLPIKLVGGALITLRDIGNVRDGNPPQTNIVRVDGERAVLMTILKSGAASTLDIVNKTRQLLPKIAESLPPAVRLGSIGDQSLFVKAAVASVAREGIIAAALTSLMILLFLGSWRSTIIIVVSIPLAILSSIAALSVVGETLNIMTLGGLALAVGILVDDATVTIENINWHLEHGKDVSTAIMDGAHQIVTPAFVSLLCICIVFVPMFFLEGVAHYLFVPMAEAVVFAMIASFILSRTLVPTMAAYLLQPHRHKKMSNIPPATGPWSAIVGSLTRFQIRFDNAFGRVRDTYYSMLVAATDNRIKVIVGFVVAVCLSFVLVPWLGRDFFPSVDAGQITMHVRAPIGTRIEETARLFDQIEADIRRVIPAEELGSVIDNIGLPYSNTNLAYSNTGTIGPQDGDIFISLRETHRATNDYLYRLRELLPQQYPGTTFSFLPADIISQILNFGLPAPIDIKVTGPNIEANMAHAQVLLREIRKVLGVADARIQQAYNYPQLSVDIDRIRAKQVGVTERDVTNSLAVTMTGSGQISPTFWLNNANGVSYPIVAQTPQYRVQTLSDLENVPIVGTDARDPQVLGGLATITRSHTAAVVSHYSVRPAIDIFATTERRDLGAVASDIETILKTHEKEMPKGATVTMSGQVQTMNTAFSGLLFGLLGAVVLIYLLIVVNFQSWSDPFVIVAALPAALAGIVWMLFATHTTLSVPALTGAIMCMGVATANSILVISFARERYLHTGDPVRASLEAGFTRFRPVIMTALAMIIGMAPIALGLGEGGEQNAPLGRAVIGGLIAATCATLIFVPLMFGLIHGRRNRPPLHGASLEH
ncbi:MAG: efflux RND transporter permease subunit [Candidatus Nitrotoga sp.]|nr:efflux RND transporter permease subunit [Candidatus Nitrotoga sp.]